MIQSKVGSPVTGEDFFDRESELQRRHAAVLDAGQVGDVTLPRRQVAEAELAEVSVATGAGQNLHQLDGGLEEALQALGGDLDR